MSTINNAFNKQPYKLIEIPLNKFHEEVIPHHQTLYESHKSIVHKLLITKDFSQVSRDINDKRRVVRQLKNLMYELDTLRTQVEDCDLGKFDSRTVSLRKTILELTRNYAALESKATEEMQNEIIISDNNQNLSEPEQLQIQGDLSELKLLEREHGLQQMDALNKDIEDVHVIFNDLNQMVAIQKESVDHVETNVEVAQENISGGLMQLIKAAKYKKASYPVAGALIGTVIGGPIGSLAGLKVGGFAAIVCGTFGYVSGRFIKKTGDDETVEEIMSQEEVKNDESGVICEKKDI